MAKNTGNKILASAWQIFILCGYNGTTLDKITRDAGVSKAIIHYYFRTKNNLYQEIVEMIADVILHERWIKYYYIRVKVKNAKTV